MGGLGVPDLERILSRYYIAVHFNRLIDWQRNSESKKQIGLERDLVDLDLFNDLNSRIRILKITITIFITIKTTQEVCKRAVNKLAITPYTLPL